MPVGDAYYSSYSYGRHNPMLFHDVTGTEPRVWKAGRTVGVPMAGGLTASTAATMNTAAECEAVACADDGGGSGGGLWGSLSSAWDSTTSAISGAAHSVGNAASNVWDATASAASDAWDATEDFWGEYGDEFLLVAGLVAAGVCIVASAGLCVGVTVAVATATIIDGKSNRGWSNEQAVTYGLVTALSLGTAGGATSLMTHTFMGARSVARVEAAALSLQAEAVEVVVSQYVLTGAMTNVPGAVMAGMHSR